MSKELAIELKTTWAEMARSTFSKHPQSERSQEADAITSSKETDALAGFEKATGAQDGQPMETEATSFIDQCMLFQSF